MVLREKLYTVEEFIAFAQRPENEDKRLELDNGVIIEMAPSTPLNTIVAMRIAYFFNAFVIPNAMGYVTGPDGGYKLVGQRVRQPDVAFISKQRAPEIPRAFDIAPDLAVEVVSPDEDIFKKTQEYLNAGTQMVWAAYADEKMVYVFHMEQDGSMRSVAYGIDDVLDGGDVLPGFKLPVRDIFPD